MKCRVCENADGNREYEVLEMMFGTREAFRYFLCASCRCLQIAEIPSNLADYYPDHYYSYRPPPRRNPVKRLFARWRDAYAFHGKGLVGRVVFSRYPREDLSSLRGLNLTRGSRILDVGCGSGTLLRVMQGLGFVHLLGVDPYNKNEIRYGGGLRILNAELEETGGLWDCVMFHRSFEHIADPADTLRTVSRLLAPGGVCVICASVTDSCVWEHYGVNWVQVDAPRHLVIPSVGAVKMLAERAGLVVIRIIYDSTAFQFWASEQYRRGIPLRDPRSYYENPKASVFSKREISAFRARARALNEAGRGDHAAFILKGR